MHSFLQTLTENYFSDTFVVHAHPPNIIAYTGLNDNNYELHNIKLTFPELNVGKIGLNVKDHHAGSYELANNCLQNLKDHEIVEKKIITQNINSILDQYKFYDIDFMNLDVEGHEIEVLKSIDFNKINITYLCVEIINHNEQSIEKGKQIHSYLTLNGYQLVKELDFNYIYKKK